MAATSSTTRGIAKLGKRFVSQVRTTVPVASLSPAIAASRRSVYTSIYDKNVEEHVRPAVVHDNVNNQESDQYWAPHPHTGVFGPITDASAVGSRERGFHSSRALATGGYDSIVEEKAFFRPLEDLDKP